MDCICVDDKISQHADEYLYDYILKKLTKQYSFNEKLLRTTTDRRPLFPIEFPIEATF